MTISIDWFEKARKEFQNSHETSNVKLVKQKSGEYVEEVVHNVEDGIFKTNFYSAQLRPKLMSELVNPEIENQYFGAFRNSIDGVPTRKLDEVSEDALKKVVGNYLGWMHVDTKDFEELDKTIMPLGGIFPMFKMLDNFPKKGYNITPLITIESADSPNISNNEAIEFIVGEKRYVLMRGRVPKLFDAQKRSDQIELNLELSKDVNSSTYVSEFFGDRGYTFQRLGNQDNLIEVDKKMLQETYKQQLTPRDLLGYISDAVTEDIKQLVSIGDYTFNNGKIYTSIENSE